MATQQHRVRRQVLEIQLPQEDAARDLHLNLGRMQRDYFESIVDQCCTEMSSPDRIHRIDKLELNLGSVTFAQMEIDLPRRLQTAMRQALRDAIQVLDTKYDAGDGHPATRSQLELLAIFAMNGALPWWADSRLSRHVPKSLEFLLSHAPEDLASLLRDLAQHPGALQRIVLHSEDQLLLRMFDVLLPPWASAVRQQAMAIFSGPWLKATLAFSPAKTALWIAVLTHARWHTFSASAPTSPQPSASSAPSDFWMSVFDSVWVHSPAAVERLLIVTSQPPPSADPDVQRAITPIAAALAEVGRRHGRLPNRMFNQGMDGLPTTASSDETPHDRARETMVAPEDAHRLDAIPKPIGQDRATPLESLPAKPQQQPDPALSPSCALPVRSRDPRPLDLGFADVESVYVENSGLVILWPFLERFFERLQLLHEKNFVDVASRHRAAGLLQYVATEDPSPPEYQMWLNKMLCGISPDDLLDIGSPVTDDEMQECAGLLSAAIENAPVLRNMSHEGFRGSFLLRKGALSAAAGNWLLRVESETFDIVLDRFPWSFGWIKLPWMDVPLGVEW